MTFHGPAKMSEKVMEKVHEAPKVMMVPLIILALGAVLVGFIGFDAFVGEGREAFWAGSIFVLPDRDVIEGAHHAPFWVAQLPLVVGLAGIFLAWMFYIRRPDLPSILADKFRALYELSLNKWYIDEAFDFLFVRPAYWLGRVFWTIGDMRIIDGFGPDGIAALVRRCAGLFGRFQSGLVYNYAFVMVFGILIFFSWIFYRVVI